MFFILLIALVNIFIINYKDYLIKEEKNFGGPVINLTYAQAALPGSLFYSSNPDEVQIPLSPLFFEEGALALGTSPFLSNISFNRDNLIIYKVMPGDTLSSIAANFGISIETLKWANPGLKDIIKTGQKIVILPVSGLIYKVKEGDNMETVLNRYGVNFELFKKYNPDYQESFVKNKTVILPYALPLKEFNYKRSRQELPDLGNYFALPTRGWNWGELHYFNAVDIANVCGEPIYASAEGLVIEESDGNRWNNGYGNYVLIEHPNGTKTRYAHTLRNLVKVGDYVAKGDKISLIGNTGNTHGPTGCHLHFEVYGAKNPFATR